MNKSLLLSESFSIPAIDYASQGNAVLGIRDAGKTYTAMKAAEQLLDAGIPIIVFDPVGVWKNLKIGTGKHKGYPIVVAGGAGSDILLTTGNAVDIVRAAMKENVSLVIDLYSPELINKSTWIKIVQEAVDVLMYENKEFGMRHIFLEEAAEFIPQRLQPQHARVYASLERLARMGRNARLGMTIINQRAEEVNKAILEICALVLLHKQVGKNSLKSIQQWLELRQLDDVKDIIKSLPALKQGQCWAIGMSDQPKLIQVSLRNTFHPDPKKEPDKVIKMLAIDVSGFVEKMNRQLVKAEPVKAAHGKKKEHDNSGQIAILELQLKETKAELEMYKGFYENAKKALHNVIEVAIKEVEKAKTGNVSTVTKNDTIGQEIRQFVPKININVPVSGKKVSSAVTGGAMRMLKAAAMFHPGTITRSRMAALAVLSPTSGSFGTYLATLKREELITGDSQVFQITAKGLQHAGNIEPLPTDPGQLIDMWCNVVGNGSGAARMLRVLGENYPTQVSRDELGKLIDMSHTSGSFGTYLATLKRNSLIVVNGSWVKASDELFNN